MGLFSGKRLLNAAIGGGIGFLTGGPAGAAMGAGAGLMSSADADEQYKYQKKLNNAQMAFQAQQAATSHQREVADLEAAGLNPILSAGGTGASAMSGASGSAPVVDRTAKALQIAQMKLTERQIENQEKATKNDTQRVSNETKRNIADINKTNAETKKIEEDTEKTKGGTISNIIGTDTYRNAKNIGKRAAEKAGDVASSGPKKYIKDKKGNLWEYDTQKMKKRLYWSAKDIKSGKNKLDIL